MRFPQVHRGGSGCLRTARPARFWRTPPPRGWPAKRRPRGRTRQKILTGPGLDPHGPPVRGVPEQGDVTAGCGACAESGPGRRSRGWPPRTKRLLIQPRDERDLVHLAAQPPTPRGPSPPPARFSSTHQHLCLIRDRWERQGGHSIGEAVVGHQTAAKGAGQLQHPPDRAGGHHESQLPAGGSRLLGGHSQHPHAGDDRNPTWERSRNTRGTRRCSVFRSASRTSDTVYRSISPLATQTSTSARCRT